MLFQNELGGVVATMRDNAFECDHANLHDLEVDSGATFIKIYFSARKVGLEVSFSRITPEQLAQVIAEDRAVTAATDPNLWKKRLDFLERIPEPRHPKAQKDIDDLKTLKNAAPLILQELEFFSSSRNTESPDFFQQRILSLAKAECLDDEGMIPLLDFQNLSVFSKGRKFVVRNGFVTESIQIRGFVADGGIAFDWEGDTFSLKRPSASP